MDLVKLVHEASVKEKFLSKDELIQQNSDVFSGLGLFKEPYDIKLKSGVTPKIHPPRRVSLAIHDRLKQKLNDMEAAGVIRKTTDTKTAWAETVLFTFRNRRAPQTALNTRGRHKSAKHH